MKKILILMTILMVLAISLMAEVVIPNPVNEVATLAAETMPAQAVEISTPAIPLETPTRGLADSIPWGTAITLLITALGWLGFGGYWLKFKNVITELKELLVTISDAISDDKLTELELKNILKQAKDILLIFSSTKREQVLVAKRR